MKSLREYSLNLPEQEYHDLPVWSHSLIADYARNGFGALATLHDKKAATPSMEFGSLFDSFITRGKETLKYYTVSDINVTPAEKVVLDELAKQCDASKFDMIPTSDVLDVAAAVGYRPDYKKPETRYNHIAEFGAYYDAVKSGKKIVSQDDWSDALEMYNAFRANPYLKELFGTKDTEDVEYIYQSQFKVPWVIEGEEIDVKIMPDLLVVDHRAQTIQPVDLKTSSMPAYDFAENFVKFRYDLQAEMYTDVLVKVCAGDKDYENYIVLPYIFADISRVDKVPVCYKYDPSEGFSYTKGDKTYQYKGWQELLSEILVYEANEAKVPNWITTDEPNDIVSILCR